MRISFKYNRCVFTVQIVLMASDDMTILNVINSTVRFEYAAISLMVKKQKKLPTYKSNHVAHGEFSQQGSLGTYMIRAEVKDLH